MSVLVSIVLPALGAYLAMHTLAALYGFIDLRYTMRTAWRRVLQGVLIWGGLTMVCALLLPMRAALLWGFAGYVVFYVVVALVLSRIVMPGIARRLGSSDP